jgi:hypothetical protein
LTSVPTIETVIAQRRIEEVLHFTSNHGLVGSLAIGSVISRKRLPEHNHLAFVAAPTSRVRQEALSYFNKDENWLDYVNMSLSELNCNYYNFAKGWHSDDRWWVILSFSPELLSEPGVYFTTTNNVYEHVHREKGSGGLQKLFAPRINRKGTWYATRQGRIASLPTCQQAEVLVPEQVPISFLRRIYVLTEDHHDLVVGWLGQFKIENVEVLINERKFEGQPN